MGKKKRKDIFEQEGSVWAEEEFAVNRMSSFLLPVVSYIFRKSPLKKSIVQQKFARLKVFPINRLYCITGV
jgi:hypothetical protein